MPGEEGDKAPGPPVPGVWRLGWMFFYQPIKLHEMFRAWGLEGDPSIIYLWPRLRAGDRVVRTLLVRWMLCLALLIPMQAAMIVCLLRMTNVPINLFGVCLGVALGALVGMALGVTVGMTRAVAAGVAIDLTVGVAAGATTGIPLHLAERVVIGVVVGGGYSLMGGTVGGVIGEVILGRTRRVGYGVLYGISCGILYGIVYGVGGSLGVALIVGVLASATILRLLGWPIEALLTLALAWLIRLRPTSAQSLSAWLPFRHHDLIYLPLPGMRSFLLKLAEIDAVLCNEIIAEAAASTGQSRAARLALVELQARALERAVTQQLFARTADLDLPFLPSLDALDEDGAMSPLLAFQSAAKDLIAGGTNQRQRHLALDRAQKIIESFRTTTALERRPDPLARRLLSTAALWLDDIREERHKLALEEAKNPEVPAAFIAGPPLHAERPENRTLFKGRDDIIKLIEHDLAPDRRGVLLVFGQRRMGKTSLRNYLPTYLGTGTTVVVSDFQSLSGDSDRETPHRRILNAIAEHAPAAPEPADSPRWGEALRWLQDVDKTLIDRSILVVIDEIERVEDGIRAGWCTPDFLDFLRAAGDSLRRIRFLLLTAYPLHRLGPHWVDRLISATSRSISYLDEPDARDLLLHPIPDFPDIYPEAGVDRILAQTGRHPYLLQKVGDELCRLLNARGGRRRATPDELTEVFDTVVRGADLFDELWRQRTDDERAALLRLARAGEPADPDPAALQLVREGYVKRCEGGKVAITVPLFQDWILDTQGTG